MKTHIGYTQTIKKYVFEFSVGYEEEVQSESESKNNSENSNYKDIPEESDDESLVEEIKLEENDGLVKEVEYVYLTFGRSNNLISTICTKQAIVCYYLNVCGAPPEDSWKGKDGVINQILDEFKIRNQGHYMWVRNIVEAVRECIVEKHTIHWTITKKERGTKHILITASKEGKIVTATMEKGLGLGHAT